jgi:hypothetical protein
MSNTRRPAATPAVKPIEVSPELKSLMRRLKLGQLLDTLPERLAVRVKIFEAGWSGIH